MKYIKKIKLVSITFLSTVALFLFVAIPTYASTDVITGVQVGTNGLKDFIAPDISSCEALYNAGYTNDFDVYFTFGSAPYDYSYRITAGYAAHSIADCTEDWVSHSATFPYSIDVSYPQWNLYLPNSGASTTIYVSYGTQNPSTNGGNYGTRLGSIPFIYDGLHFFLYSAPPIPASSTSLTPSPIDLTSLHDIWDYTIGLVNTQVADLFPYMIKAILLLAAIFILWQLAKAYAGRNL